MLQINLHCVIFCLTLIAVECCEAGQSIDIYTYIATYVYMSMGQIVSETISSLLPANNVSSVAACLLSMLA